MFIGHFAVGFAARRLDGATPLSGLLLAAIFADVLGSVLFPIGAEHVRITPGITAYTPLEFVSIPWSHSLLMMLIWGGLIGAFFRSRPRGRRQWAVISAVVVSHWFLDWIMHRPDMPIYPGGPEYGLGIWDNVTATVIVELTVFAAGVVAYASSTRARDRIGTWAFRGLVVLLLLLFIFDALYPPSSTAELWMGNLAGTAVLLALAWWIDRHRETRVLQLESRTEAAASAG